MKQHSILIFVFLIIMPISFPTTSAQFPLKIPKLPKTEKPKQEQPKIEDGNQNQSTPAKQPSRPGADTIYKNTRPTNVPILLKNSMYVQAKAHNEYWKMPNLSNYSSWIPMIKFDQFYNNDKQLNYTVEYFKPDGSSWFSETLEQGFRAADWTVSFQSSNPFERLKTKSTTAIGVYSFKITNQDSKEVIFQGKFKVGKFSTENGRDQKNKFDFFVEHDWLLPFGMFGLSREDLEVGGVQPEVSVWLKGMVKADELEGRIFYQGRQIALSHNQSERNGMADFDQRTTEFAAPFAPNNTWKRWRFQWHNFRFDNNGTFQRDNYPNAFYADKNPGEYIVKIYRSGTQIRELSFSIGADGKIVVPAWTNQIPLPFYRIVVPVKIIGAEKWDSMNWKTEAFYGNPLAGFNIP